MLVILVFMVVGTHVNNGNWDTTVLGYTDFPPFSYEHQNVNGRWQVFLKSRHSEQHIQLSHTQNTANPAIDNGKMVWEGFIGGTWQLFLFDGIAVTQITSGDTSINPYIEGNYVVIGRKGGDSAWYAELYNILSGETKTVAQGIGAKRPLLEEGKIVLYGTGNKEYTDLMANELLPTDPSLTESARSVRVEDIKKELGIT